MRFERTCGNCRHWEKIPSVDDVGHCFAPRPISDNMVNTRHDMSEDESARMCPAFSRHILRSLELGLVGEK